MHLYGDDNDIIVAVLGNDPVAVDPAPGRYIVQGARIGGVDLQLVAVIQLRDPVLGPDHRQGTEQVTGVQSVAAQTCHSAGICSGFKGVTATDSARPVAGSTIRTWTHSAVFPLP